MSDLLDICTICGEGRLREQVGKNVAEYKGQTTEIDLHYSVCDACGSEQSNATQLRDNKRGMMAFKKRVDCLLGGVEVREIRERLGVNQAEAARIFGGGPVAFSKYESDDVAQSEAMDKLLRLSVAMPMAFGYLRRMAGLCPVAESEWTAEKMVTSYSETQKLRVVSTSTLMAEQTWRKSA